MDRVGVRRRLWISDEEDGDWGDETRIWGGLRYGDWNYGTWVGRWIDLDGVGRINSV